MGRERKMGLTETTGLRGKARDLAAKFGSQAFVGTASEMQPKAAVALNGGVLY
jgi:hypothetical protein